MGLVFSGCVRNGAPSNASDQGAGAAVNAKPLAIEAADTAAPVFASGATVTNSVNENQSSAITLNASDETSAVSYSIVGGDAARFKLDSKTGEITFATAPDYEASPAKNSYLFAAIAKDEALNESSQTVTINVLDVDEAIPNERPVANAGKNQSVKKGAKATLDASSSSDDGKIVGYAWSEDSTKLSSSESFEISTLGVGTHKITLKVTDDLGASDSDSVLVSVSGPTNQTPKASDQSLSVGENQKLGVILSGEDRDGDSLNYAIAVNPAHGSLSGRAPRLTYAPDSGYSGEDEFSFTVNDSKSTSATATVRVSVIAVKTKGILKNGTSYDTVKSPYTGKIWLDKNLGAAQVCASLDDAACYGNYYQWGRDHDGHQESNSARTSAQAKKSNRAGTKFIKRSEDWSSVDHNGAKRASNWSATDGSSICPTGYRVPTTTELAAETTAATSPVANNTDAFKNFLKLPSAGYRYANNGDEDYQVSYGFVWTASAVGSNEANNLQFDVYDAVSKESYRAFAFSVRCVKN